MVWLLFHSSLKNAVYLFIHPIRMDHIKLSKKNFNHSLWAPATKVRQNLSIMAKNENSTEHFVHLHADYLYMENTLCELN